MACPYFVPVEKSATRFPFRLPLGAFWTGECAADGDTRAPEDFQLNECNFGYSRGRCPRFPSDAAADAVRFSRRDAERLFILEKDHVPVSFGPVDSVEPGTILEKQAQAWNGT